MNKIIKKLSIVAIVGAFWVLSPLSMSYAGNMPLTSKLHLSKSNGENRQLLATSYKPLSSFKHGFTIKCSGVLDANHRKLIARVKKADIGNVKKGYQILASNALKMISCTGKIEAIDNKLVENDEDGLVYNVTIALDKNTKVNENATMDVKIITPGNKNTYVIPKDSVSREKGTSYITVGRALKKQASGTNNSDKSSNPVTVSGDGDAMVPSKKVKLKVKTGKETRDEIELLSIQDAKPSDLLIIYLYAE